MEENVVLTKNVLAQELINKQDMPKNMAERIIDDIFDIMTEALVSGKEIKIHKFMTIETKVRPERQGRNPKTGESITIPATKAITMKPAPGLKTLIKEAK